MKELVTFTFEESEYHQFVDLARSKGMSLRRLMLEFLEKEIPRLAKESETLPDNQ